MAPNFCMNLPDKLLPCTTGANRNKTVRSKHPSGVNASMSDGSVRFITNNIDVNTWMSIGTMNGGESLSDF